MVLCCHFADSTLHPVFFGGNFNCLHRWQMHEEVKHRKEATQRLAIAGSWARVAGFRSHALKSRQVFSALTGTMQQVGAYFQWELESRRVLSHSQRCYRRHPIFCQSHPLTKFTQISEGKGSLQMELPVRKAGNGSESNRQLINTLRATKLRFKRRIKLNK